MKRKRHPKQQPPKPKPFHKPKPKRITERERLLSKMIGENEFRSLPLNELELDWLIELSEQRGFPFPALRNRLKDLKGKFTDEMLRLKELTARMKANAFFVDEKTGRTKGKVEKFGDVSERHCVSAQELKKMLKKEANENHNSRRVPANT